MNLRPIFHVPASIQAERNRPRMPSLIDVDIDFVDEPEVRGRSFETWNRSRGWASED